MRDEMTSQLRERTDHILTMTLGRDWRRAMRVAFDSDRAMQSLRLYRFEDIPRIGGDLPPEVSDVTFKVELTDAIQVSGSVRPKAGSLVHAFLGAIESGAVDVPLSDISGIRSFSGDA